MIKSMTGFGRCEIQETERKITVEMKSVNHRYLDVSMKMPKKLNFFEASVRSELKNYIQRGKVDIFIAYEDYTQSNVCLKYNKELAAEYVSCLQKMTEDFSLVNDVGAVALSRYPEVLVMEEQSLDEEKLWSLLERAVKGAAEGFVETRLKEGEHLKNDGSLERIAMGQAWRTAAGGQYRYYMVFRDGVEPLPGAVSMSRFLELVKEL